MHWQKGLEKFLRFSALATEHEIPLCMQFCKDLNIIGYANLRKAEIISLIHNYVADPS